MIAVLKRYSDFTAISAGIFAIAWAILFLKSYPNGVTFISPEIPVLRFQLSELVDWFPLDLGPSFIGTVAAVAAILGLAIIFAAAWRMGGVDK